MSSLPSAFEPYVSVVVPCFNGIGTISDCLNSLEGQSYPRDRFEILLVDNGSTDGTCELVRSSFTRVQLLHSVAKGSGYARNCGIEQARGELILSTDADCVADRNWVASLVRAFTTAPSEVAAIGGTILPFSEKTAVERYRLAWVGQPGLHGGENEVRYTATPNAAFRAATIRSVGGFDGALGFDDTDLGIRLHKAGAKVSFTDAALIYHRNPSTLKEIFEHKKKYGRFAFQLAVKHPEIFGDPRGSAAASRLLLPTIRRLVGDVLVKLPWALIAGAGDRPRSWPLIDAAMALGNYLGYARAASNSLSR